MRKIEMTNKWTQDDFQRAQFDRDRWRRAHEIVEGERDLARDRCRELERERDGAVQARNTALVLVSQAQDERDLARERCLELERERDEAASQFRVVAQKRIVLGELMKAAEYERDEWKARALKAEGKTDPVEDKARELYEVANTSTVWNDVVQSAEQGNRMDIQVAREYRAIAAHVLLNRED